MGLFEGDIGRGKPRVDVDTDALKRALRAGAKLGVQRASLELKADIQIKLNRFQKTRIVGGRRVGLDPSLPGEPPKRVTGRLIQSIATRVIDQGRTVAGRVGTNVVYARRLELGFNRSDSAGRFVRQAPRPFMRNTLEENGKKYFRIITSNILRAEAGVTKGTTSFSSTLSKIDNASLTSAGRSRALGGAR